MSNIGDFMKKITGRPLRSPLNPVWCICACFCCGDKAMLEGLFQSYESHMMSYYNFRHFPPAKGKRKKDCRYWVCLRKFPLGKIGWSCSYHDGDCPGPYSCKGDRK